MADIQSVDTALQKHKYTTAYRTGVAVATTSTQISSELVNRLYALIVNDSDTVIYLTLGGTAVLHQGIRLNANGGSYEINWTNLYTGSIYGIHGGTGDKVVTVVYGV